jgi:diphthamide synthase subunit DPH2
MAAWKEKESIVQLCKRGNRKDIESKLRDATNVSIIYGTAIGRRRMRMQECLMAKELTSKRHMRVMQSVEGCFA